ncbi:MAG: T9SS type A sorting domain-containing protein [Bacteroidetes bacterium]|nr:T9SS type A sorting domain-containing protein [Bacteroidota bacterium]
MKTLVLLSLLLVSQSLAAQTIFFRESFDDVNFTQRGWYDNSTIPTTASEFHGSNGMAAEYIYLKGGTKAKGSAIRKQFAPSNSVYLSYWVKYSSNFVGSGKPYHPHEFHFTTNLNDKYVGPSWTKMTLYIEQNNGYPMLAFQDSQNIDTANIKKDLTSVSEFRSCGGCNGSSDGYPAGDCYKSGANWFNGKAWKSKVRTFADSGAYNKNQWHFIEAYFKLNSIAGGKGVADGTAQYWFDGELLINAQNVMFRTNANPTMMFNQFLIAPYIGDGSPVEQTMWIDDITVADSRITTSVNDGTESQLTIHPNPADDYFTVNLENFTNTSEIILTDILGNTVRRKRVELPLKQFVISTKELPNGVYFLRLLTENSEITTRRVVIMR